MNFFLLSVPLPLQLPEWNFLSRHTFLLSISFWGKKEISFWRYSFGILPFIMSTCLSNPSSLNRSFILANLVMFVWLGNFPAIEYFAIFFLWLLLKDDFFGNSYKPKLWYFEMFGLSLKVANKVKAIILKMFKRLPSGERNIISLPLHKIVLFIWIWTKLPSS